MNKQCKLGIPKFTSACGWNGPLSSHLSTGGTRDHGGGTSAEGHPADWAQAAARLWDKAPEHWRRVAGWPPMDKKDGLVPCRV